MLPDDGQQGYNLIISILVSGTTGLSRFPFLFVCSQTRAMILEHFLGHTISYLCVAAAGVVLAVSLTSPGDFRHKREWVCA